jgi:DNA repair exonuclease SbcCD ATPase subunit
MSVNTDDIQIPIDTPQPSQEAPPVTSNSKIFTEDEVNKIRQQEKDKLYSRLEDAQNRMKTMEEQLQSLSLDRESAIKEAEERAAKEAELIRQRELEELSAKELLTRKEDEFNQKINKVEQEWAEKFQTLEQQRLAQEALLEKERELQFLETYRQRRVSEEQEYIIPELIDLISGTTQDEIEASISALRDRSSAIIESIQQASQAQAPRLKGAPVTAPPTGPLENQSEYQTLTAEDIRNMPMDQYEKMRDRLLQARSPRGRF